MHDLEFKDDPDDHKGNRSRNRNRTQRKSSSSLSVCSHSSTVSGTSSRRSSSIKNNSRSNNNITNNRKKRHRLNHGSYALSCRADPIILASHEEEEEEMNPDDQDMNVEDAITNTNTNTKTNTKTIASKCSSTPRGINDIIRPTQQTLPQHHTDESSSTNTNSTRRGKRQTRRRKKHDAPKKHNLTNAYFSSSPLMLSSPSSFLSSIKSSSASSAGAAYRYGSTGKTGSITDALPKIDNTTNHAGNATDNDEDELEMEMEMEMEIQSESKFGTPPGSPPQQPQNMVHTFHRESMQAKKARSNNLLTTRNSSSTTTTSTSTTSMGPPSHPITKVVRKEAIFSATSNNDDDDTNDVDEDDSKEDFDDARSPQSRSSHANSSIISYESERVATRAGTDMHAVQDAGSSRLMLDDCNYFCSSFLSGVGMVDVTGNGMDTESKKHCAITADSACDLAMMLTSKKTRNILMTMSSIGLGSKGTGTGTGMSQESEPSVDNNTFIHVLKVVGYTPQSIMGSYLPPLVSSCNKRNGNYYNGHGHGHGHEHGHEHGHGHKETFIDWNNVIVMSTNSDNGESSTERKDTVVDTPTTGLSSIGKRRTKNARKAKDVPNQILHAEGTVFDTAVTNALAIAAHFISLDCTFKNNSSASTSAAAAKTFQRELLRNKDFMSGLARLLIADHIVSCILESANPTAKNVTTRGTSAKDTPQDEKDAVHCGENPVPHAKVLADPTSRGRRKKRKRKVAMVELNLDSIPEEELQVNSTKAKLGRDGLDFFSDEASNNANSIQSSTSAYSTSKVPSRLRRKIASAQSKIDATAINIIESKDQDCSCIFCGDLSSAKQRREANPGNLALDAFSRILSGKMNDDEEPEDGDEEAHCSYNDEDDDDDLNEGEEGTSLDTSTESDDDGVESANLNHPMIFKNVMIRRSGAIPFLARAIAETLESCILMSMQSKVNNGKCCTGCIHYLKDRLLRLSSIIDSLCCMSRMNRKILCRVARKSQQDYEPFLLPTLVRSVSQFSAPSLLHTNPVFADIGLAALRTLTSLTHENSVASAQFYALSIVRPVPDSTAETFKGVEMILNLLQQLVEGQKQKCASQHIYDSIIFCLNSLTNVLESDSFSHVCKLLLEMSLISKEQGSICAISWISRWIVSQTESFRDAVMTGSPGQNGNNDSAEGRHLEHHEDEFLVTSGNGFILLSYLLGAHPVTNFPDESTRIQIKNLILDELPKNSNKLIFVINTLKAFCNFYRYSIGDLSVAVIAPVLKLIGGLEKVSIDD